MIDEVLLSADANGMETFRKILSDPYVTIEGRKFRIPKEDEESDEYGDDYEKEILIQIKYSRADSMPDLANYHKDAVLLWMPSDPIKRISSSAYESYKAIHSNRNIEIINETKVFINATFLVLVEYIDLVNVSGMSSRTIEREVGRHRVFDPVSQTYIIL